MASTLGTRTLTQHQSFASARYHGSAPPHHQPKQYFIPPPPPRAAARSVRPNPFIKTHLLPQSTSPSSSASSVYSQSNNSYHPDLSPPPPKRSATFDGSTPTLAGTPTSATRPASITGAEKLSGTSGGAGAGGVPTSRYIHMLLSTDAIPKAYNLLAAISVWLLLAGFLLLPGTFVSLQNTPAPEDVPLEAGSSPEEQIKNWFLMRIRNTPLLYLASTISGVGLLGMLLLWYRWRKNYIWLVNRIFLPGLLNSLAGLITTIVNVQTAQKGDYGLVAIVTLSVSGTGVLGWGAMAGLYTYWVGGVRKGHWRDFFGGDEETAERKDEKESRKSDF